MCDKLWPAKAMYAINCISSAAIWNYLVVFFQQDGFSKTQIGILQAIPPICCILGAPFWGGVADKFDQQRLVHIFTIVTGCLLMYCLQFFTTFWLMCVMVVLANLQTAPIGPLMDQSVMTLLKQEGGEYGKQRLFGGIGYGLGSYVTGLIIASSHDISWAFSVHVLFAFVSLFVLSYLPPGGREDDVSADFSSGLRKILQSRSILYMFLVVFCLGLMFGVINSFLPLYLFNLSNGNAQIIGLATLSATMGELPAFFFAKAVVEKIGTTYTILLSILAYAVRLTYYTMAENAWSVLPFELLHGITFSISWAACTNYTFREAPPGTIATMLGLLSAMLNGYGKGMGTLVGGYVYDRYGGKAMWLATDLVVPVALAALALFHFETKKTMKKENPSSDSPRGPSHLVDEVGLLSPASPARLLGMVSSPVQSAESDETDLGPLLNVENGKQKKYNA